MSRFIPDLPVDTTGWEVVPEFDTRDFTMKNIVGDTTTDIPTVDLSQHMHYVINQNNGSCAGESIANSAFYATDTICNGEATYKWAKANECPIPNQEGTTSLAINKAGMKFGAASQAIYPRLPRTPDWKDYPSLDGEVEADAGKRKSTGFFRITEIHEYAQALKTTGPVNLALMWTDSFHKPEFCKKTGRAFVKFPSGKMMGGHMVVGVSVYPDLQYTYEDGTTEEGFGALFNTHGWGFGKNGVVHFPLRVLTEKMKDFPVPFCMDMRVQVYEQKSNVKIVKMDVSPGLVSDRTFLPIRPLAEALGCKVDFDFFSQRITITKPGRKIEMTVGSRMVDVNGSTTSMDVAPFIVNDGGGRTMVPVRAIAELLGGQVHWENGRIETIVDKDAAVMFVGEKYLVRR